MNHQDAAGVYVHVPFCSAICPYCDFAVVRDRRSAHTSFVAALIDELMARQDEIERLGTVDTIYLGGGTPSVLGTEHLESVLGALFERLDLATECAIFLEANPEDVDARRLGTWRALGIRVLTLGVQALDDASLAFLGRRHSADQARSAVLSAVAAGFDTVSFDLIYGLPRQSAESWSRTLDQAAGLGAEHISCYQLTIESNTPFARQAAHGSLSPLPDRLQADLFFLTHQRLGEHGFEGYEVSNLARTPRHRSRHNQKYWRHLPYLGIGPSAHSFDGRVRRWNERHLHRWHRRLVEDGTAEAGRERLSDVQLATEALMLGFRTHQGVDLEACRRRFGFDLLSGNRQRVEQWLDDGLLDRRTGTDGGLRLAPSLRGMAVADSLASQWILDHRSHRSPES